MPAYNEERRIAPLLESLARRLGAAVRRAPPRPPGWIGKTRACRTGDRIAGGAFGACIVVSRGDYRRAGGHAAVRDRVAEDVALGDRARRIGMRVTCLAG